MPKNVKGSEEKAKKTAPPAPIKTNMKPSSHATTSGLAYDYPNTAKGDPKGTGGTVAKAAADEAKGKHARALEKKREEDHENHKRTHSRH